LFLRNPLDAPAIRFSCLAALLMGVVWNISFGISDVLGRRNLPDSTRSAMRLMPGDAAWAAQLADELFATDPETSKSMLQRAVKLNRYDASSWIQLGLLLEARNDLAQAESALLRAADADATFLPNWSLANFYFRHQNSDRFWYWALRAAQMAPGDATPLFRLAWYMQPNVHEIENRLRLTEPAVEGQLVNFLISRNYPEGVEQASLHLLSGGNHENTDSLLGAIEWLIEQKRPDLALPLWNGLAERHQTPYAPLTSSADTVTNSRFRISPASKGFDWHLPPVDGVTSFLNTHPDALGFELSGNEPDAFQLLSQVVPTENLTSYSLAIEYATSGIAPGTGLAWMVTDGQSGTVLTKTASLYAEQRAGEGADNMGVASACFTTPARGGFVSLSLAYQRQPGTVRPQGRLTLRQVRVARASGSQCQQKKMSPAMDASGF
jgi:tetratricopeptide (TPR) repeat protein